MQNYENEIRYTELELMKYHDDISGWTSLKTLRGVDIQYRKSPHFSGNLYKFECDFDAPDDLVFHVLKPPVNRDERLAWDKSVKDYQCLEKIRDDLLIILVVSHSALGGLIASREFVTFSHFKPHQELSSQEYDRVSWILSKQVEHQSRPVTRQFVRADVYPTGYAVSRYAGDSSKCRLTMYFNTDIGGLIPRSMIERALPSGQVAYIEAVREQVKRLQSGQ